MRLSAALIIVISLLVNSFAAGPAARFTVMEYKFHSVVPLGADALLLRPAKKTVYLLASAESSGFEGMRRIDSGSGAAVLASDGSRVRAYPEFVDFRVTVSTRKDKPPNVQPYPVEADTEVSDYVTGLRFRLKIFHGINTTQVEPDLVKMIGVPADVPAEERVYRISFQLDNVPVEDRIVLEVLSPAGDRVSKFHLEMI